MAELGVTGVMSSIHAVDPARHDAFTGVPGSQRTALAFLRACREAGMLTGFNTVLSDREIVEGGIDAIMEFAAHFVAAQTDVKIDLPAGELILQNIVLLFLPMLCGALFRRAKPEAARRAHALLGRAAFPALMVLVAVFFLQHASTILENLKTLGIAAGTLILLAMGAGSLLSRGFGLSGAARRTIVIEVGMQNAAQAIAVAVSPLIFNDAAMAVPAIIYALLMNVVLLVYVKLAQRLRPAFPPSAPEKNELATPPQNF